MLLLIYSEREGVRRGEVRSIGDEKKKMKVYEWREKREGVSLTECCVFP